MKLISNVSINKQLKNFQNCFSVLFQLCQVEGLREVFSLVCWQDFVCKLWVEHA